MLTLEKLKQERELIVEGEVKAWLMKELDV